MNLKNTLFSSSQISEFINVNNKNQKVNCKTVNRATEICFESVNPVNGVAHSGVLVESRVNAF